MKPVKQTDTTFTTGNCWASCIASILEVPLDEVPNFVDETGHDPEGPDWYRRTYNWLTARGFTMMNINYPIPPESQAILPDGYVVFTGPSPRNKEKLHSVVGRVETSYSKEGHRYDLRFTHDPHPDDSFFAGEPPKEITFLFRLIVSDSPATGTEEKQA